MSFAPRNRDVIAPGSHGGDGDGDGESGGGGSAKHVKVGVKPPISTWTCLTIYLSIYLSIHLSIYLSIYLYTHPSTIHSLSPIPQLHAYPSLPLTANRIQTPRTLLQ